MPASPRTLNSVLTRGPASVPLSTANATVPPATNCQALDMIEKKARRSSSLTQDGHNNMGNKNDGYAAHA